MTGLIEWLEGLSHKDTKVRAALRRSLSFDPGAYPPAYPYVEPFLQGEDHPWRREMHYLVAGLWALHGQREARGDRQKLGLAAAVLFEQRDRSPSIERRFITLLDSDRDQLPYRLRQMVALLKEHSLDFGDILKGLLFWHSEKKSTQNQWARDFYRNLSDANESESYNSEESEQ